MSTVVIMPGGFHPFHAGHLALYQSAQRAFPGAEVFVAATNDTSERPFPFAVKEKLAKLAGVEPGHFVQVKSPFQALKITSKFDPAKDHLIFVRSEKDSGLPPQPGRVKKDGSPGYLQPLLGAKKLEPFAKHAYMAYLPTVEFGPGMTSATEIRRAWPGLDERRKTALVMSLYPRTQGNIKLANSVVSLLDAAIGTAATESVNPVTANTAGAGAGMKAGYAQRENQPVAEDQPTDPLAGAVINFYQPLVSDINKQPVDDYVDRARELLQKTDSPGVRQKLIDIFKAGNKNPYIQGGIITTVGAVLAGGVLSSTQKLGMSPAQTNLVLQAILNTVIPTLVSRVNGRNWRDTIKYTLASAGVGTGIAGAGLLEDNPDYIEEKWSQKYKSSINCSDPRGFSQRAHCAGRRKNEDVAEAFGPLPKDNQQIRLGRHTVDIERVGLNNNYIGFTWHDSRGQEHYEEVPVGDLGSYDDLIARIKGEIQYQERRYTDQGMAETQLAEKCWDTHRQAGMKKKGNRMVPNCVPKESSK